ncbi:MAG TPA: trigger factor [Terriglobales bacterium]
MRSAAPTIRAVRQEMEKRNVSPSETSTATKREIEVEVPHQEVARETESLIQKYQKLARLPGFRRGHVPASVVRQRFAQELQNDVVDALVPRYFRKETEKRGLVPISQPRVTDLHFHDGEPLRFKASFEVMPEIKVEGYKDLRADKPEITVTDEDVEQSLKNIQEEHATYAAVEGRPLADGDFAQVSLDGVPKDHEGKPVHMDEVLVEIGGKNTVPEFSENLRGASAGESKTFDVVYADDFADKRLAGKTLTYTIKVQAIKSKTVPELNDQFATELGEFKTFDDVRNRIRENILADRKHTAEREAKDKLIAELIKRNQLDVPEALVERQVDLRLERGLRALAAQGMKQQDMKKMDFSRLRAGQRDQAVQEVKATLLLDKIADEEKIAVTDEEINREIETLAAQTKQSADTVRQKLTEDGAIERIRSRMRNEKALDFLYQQSA